MDLSDTSKAGSFCEPKGNLNKQKNENSSPILLFLFAGTFLSKTDQHRQKLLFY